MYYKKNILPELYYLVRKIIHQKEPFFVRMILMVCIPKVKQQSKRLLSET